MKVTILSHNLSSNAAMRAHRLAVAARHFAAVTVIGPVERGGLWPALPEERWIRTVAEKRFPGFHRSFLELVDGAQGDVLVAVKPQLASYGVALVAAERRGVPVILDLDDLDMAFAPRSQWAEQPVTADLRRPGSAVYVSLLTRAVPAASGVTVASSALQERFGGRVVPHGCLTELFNPGRWDRAEAWRAYRMEQPTVLFAGTPRHHKGLKPLAKAVRRLPGVRLAVLARPQDLPGSEWGGYPLDRLPMISYLELPRLLAAADVVAIPQLDTEAGRHQMPMKVYDCMAMGKPIVASAVSDLPSVLAGRGRLVAPGSSRELRHAIADLLRNQEEAEELGRKARVYCLEHFCMKRVGERLRAVVDQVCR